MKSREKNKIKINNKFNFARLKRSFRAAFCGIKDTYKREQNIKIHSIVAILVIIFGFICKINYYEWLVCIILIGLVIMAEFFNTAIENVVDLASPDIHPLAKIAKDTASAGVLMIAIVSAIIGLIIFIPKIIMIVGGMI